MYRSDRDISYPCRMRGRRQAVSAWTGPLCLSGNPKRAVSICFWRGEHRVEELCPEDTMRCLSTSTQPSFAWLWFERDATASVALKNDCCVFVREIFWYVGERFFAGTCMVLIPFFKMPKFDMRRWRGMNRTCRWYTPPSSFTYSISHPGRFVKGFSENNRKVLSTTKRKPLSRGRFGERCPFWIYIIPLLCCLDLELASISKVSARNPGHLFTKGLFSSFPRRHHCSIFTTHWAMTLFSSVCYTSTFTVVTGIPLPHLVISSPE